MSVRQRWACLGVPVDSLGCQPGAPPFGTELAPAALRARDLVSRLGAGDHGDLDVRITGADRDRDSGLVGWPSVGAMTAAVRSAVGGLVTAGERPFVLGGCCALVMGAVAGARDVLGRVGLVSVDGHLDLYDNRSSPTGEAADMPAAALLGFGWPGLLAEMGTAPVLTGGQVSLLGARDPDEQRDIGDLPGRLGVLARDVRACADDPARTAASVTARYSAQELPYWLHLDVDVLSCDVFPATDYLMPDGLDFPQLTSLLSHFGTDSGLAGFSVGCYSPAKDPGGHSGDRLSDCLVRAFG
jgi:arginase